MYGYKACYISPIGDINKVYSKNLFEYEIGKIYELSKGEMKFCNHGFHYCDFPLNIDSYFNQSDIIVYCLVEILGDTIHDNYGHQSITNKIRIIKIISREDFFNLYTDGEHESIYGTKFNILNKKIHGEMKDRYFNIRLFNHGIEYKIDPYSKYIYKYSAPYKQYNSNYKILEKTETTKSES